jgi:acyl-CoA thioesterase-1
MVRARRALCAALALLVLPAGAGAADPPPEFRGTIVFLGTSLTAGYGVQPGQAWPERIAGWIGEARLGYRVTNLGVPGETSEQALARIDSVLRQPMSLLVVETGANDFLQGVKPEVVRANLTQILDKVRSRAPTLPILVVGMAGLGRPAAADGERYRQVYAEVAAARSLPLVPSLLEGVAFNPALNQPDLIHPNAEGHQQLAANVWTVLRTLLEGEPEVPAPQSSAALFPAPETPEAAADGAATQPEVRRAGYPVGPIWLVPRFTLGTIGLDTNVFYTPTDRVTDFTANGGPGLDVVRPIGAASEFAVGGDLRYTYYARTPSLRQLRGGGGARLGLASADGRSSLHLRQSYNTYFTRPDPTINRRVSQEIVLSDAQGAVPLVGALSLEIQGNRTDTTTTDEEGLYQGIDLTTRLTSTQYLVAPALRYHLSEASSIAGEVQRQWHRFPDDPQRDLVTDRYLLRADTLPTVKLVLALSIGLEQTRSETLGVPDRSAFFSASTATLNLGATHLGAEYQHRRTYSPFVADGSFPTVATQAYGPTVTYDLTQRLRLGAQYRYYKSVTDGVVDVQQSDGSMVGDVQRDTVHAVEGTIGYLVRDRLRFNVTARWNSRRSNVADFGFEGLLVGATLKYEP